LPLCCVVLTRERLRVGQGTFTTWAA
jgi:hypothetical protein